ncbi:hypothetical protein LTR78_008092 [Recurvomyces mirabilis]|uniref:TauD/TfdA-like domain-containing protein n=1 Tax=Recurvomyces mirabilis TaxID=574656 RepID=A0AAE0WH56_9PEZI|nr:hypothetical protein LTR78_008092 [Recurvomyces mirabilis]KAK5150819.1 hypothetical protein LTS14_009883 [Recurvomyces mirabilis]
MATQTQTIPITSQQDRPTIETKLGSRSAPKSDDSLKDVKAFDVTPVIGREYPEADLKEWLGSPKADQLIKDLAITISQRGVVFFRKQDGLTNDLQKKLVQRLGELSETPKESGLHIGPVSNSGRTLGGRDDEISVISSEQAKKLYKNRIFGGTKQSRKEGWHGDITFEHVPSDYAILRLAELPETGGDTFGERGNPENVGSELTAVHPVVRTNPVSGWKSIFAVGHHAKRINEVAEPESEHLLKWFTQLIVENHDLQVRYKWQNPNDVAIWDNRSVFHTATYDYDGVRTGQRAVSIGEKTYLDPNSTSRREALGTVAT